MEPFEPKLTAAGILYLPGSVVLGENHSLPDQRLARSFPLSATVASGDECLDALAAARRLRAQADALEAHALARLDQVRGKSRYVADEAALELRINRKTAADRIERAKALVRRMPKALRLMAEGEFEGYTAERIATAAAMLSDGQAREVDERLYAKVRDGKVGVSDPANLVRATRRLVEKVDPDGQVARARKARVDRKVQLIHQDNGMSTLLADLPAEIAASAYARIDALARRARNGGDERTLEQLRADIFADLLLGNEPGVAVPSAAAMVYVHVPVNTALLMSHSGCVLEGYGPVPAAVAREMMTNPNSVLRKVITDVDGVVTGIGATKRRPNTALAEMIRARDQECTTPGCHRTARHCDLDHEDEVHDGGITEPDNMGPKCEHCHYLKDHPDWLLEYDPAAGFSKITTPSGRIYTKERIPVIESWVPMPQR